MPDPFKSLADLVQKSVARYAGNPLFGTRGANGDWTYTTYGEFGTLVDDFRGGLASVGIGAGDRVEIISDNRVEWAVTAYATYTLGACIVPMYEKQNADDWRFIVRDSGAKVLCVASDKVAGRAAALV